MLTIPGAEDKTGVDSHHRHPFFREFRYELLRFPLGTLVGGQEVAPMFGVFGPGLAARLADGTGRTDVHHPLHPLVQRRLQDIHRAAYIHVEEFGVVPGRVPEETRQVEHPVTALHRFSHVLPIGDVAVENIDVGVRQDVNVAVGASEHSNGVAALQQSLD